MAHHAVGPDLKPSGAPTRAYDIEPHAGSASFDDRSWEVLDPARLDARRSRGRLAFSWYRIDVTIPESVGPFDVAGSTAVFEVVVDDYAEVWVDGRLPVVLGQAGGQLVKGFNAPNRVVIARGARPGQHVQIAVFAANGPLSEPPPNFIWIRSATISSTSRNDWACSPRRRRTSSASIRQSMPSCRADARVEKIATGFGFTEGPVWSPEGYLLFSDPNNNRIYRWDPMVRSRCTARTAATPVTTSGNTASLDRTASRSIREGRLTIDEHGNRRVTRLEKNGVLTVLADRYEGRRLNSPNDLVYKSDGSLYFTDPPFGLPKAFDDPRKELPFSGVFRLRTGNSISSPGTCRVPTAWHSPPTRSFST